MREPEVARVRPFGMRFSVLVFAMVAAGFAPYPEAAVASCAPASLDIAEQTVLQAGSSVTVEGRGFVNGCADSMGCTSVLGCSKCEVDDPESPMTAVTLELHQGHRVWLMDTADAGSEEDNRMGRIGWSFDVPFDAKPGRARLVAPTAQPVRVRITD